MVLLVLRAGSVGLCWMHYVLVLGLFTRTCGNHTAALDQHVHPTLQWARAKTGCLDCCLQRVVMKEVAFDAFVSTQPRTLGQAKDDLFTNKTKGGGMPGFVVSARNLKARWNRALREFTEAGLQTIEFASFRSETAEMLQYLFGCKAVGTAPPEKPAVDEYAYFNGITHLAALHQVFLRNLPYAIIFEDDLRIAQEWKSAFGKMDLSTIVASLIDQNCEMLVLGGCFSLHADGSWPKRTSNIGGLEVSVHRVPQGRPSSRCAHANLVTKKAAAKYMEVRQLDLAFDHFLNYWNLESNLCVDWLEPPMFMQGHWKPQHMHGEEWE